MLTRRNRIQWKSGILLVKWRESKAELRLNAMYVLLVYVGLYRDEQNGRCRRTGY